MSRPVQQTSAVGAAAAGSRRPAFAPSGPGAQAAATTEGYIADALAMSVCGVVDQRDRESPDTVFDLFRAAVCRLGYDRVALVPVTPAARQALGITELEPAAASNVPEPWVRHYKAENYQAFDPGLLQTPLVSGPIVWNDMLAGGRLTPKQRQVLLESREAGLFDGVSIPLHGPRGQTYVVSLATERPAVARAENVAKLQFLAVQFLFAYSRARRLQTWEPSAICITDRERECLTWTARGKSAWTIGKILDVSEHTVNFHLKRSMVKLGVTNRMQAVVSAFRLGLILP
jgi:DNA-binding CsgD family transcriptional regulator